MKVRHLPPFSFLLWSLIAIFLTDHTEGKDCTGNKHAPRCDFLSNDSTEMIQPDGVVLFAARCVDDDVGDFIRYRWTLTLKPAGSVIDMLPNRIQFAESDTCYLHPDESGDYEMTLIVDDGCHLLQRRVLTKVVIMPEREPDDDKLIEPDRDCTMNAKPIVEPIQDLFVWHPIHHSNRILLPIPVYSDADNDTLHTQWLIVMKPDLKDNQHGKLADNTKLTFSTKGRVYLEHTAFGLYTLDFHVSDGCELVRTRLNVLVTQEETSPYVDTSSRPYGNETYCIAHNARPVAIARHTEMLAEFDFDKLFDIELSVEDSYDGDNDPIDFSWDVISMPRRVTSVEVTVSNDGKSLRFRPEANGLYVFSCWVGDPCGHFDNVIIRVEATSIPTCTHCLQDEDGQCSEPDCNLNLPPSIKVHDQVAFVKSVGEGNGAIIDTDYTLDLESDRIFYRWAIINAPFGSHLGMGDIDWARKRNGRAIFFPDKEGMYEVEVQASDGCGVARDTFNVFVTTQKPPRQVEEDNTECEQLICLHDGSCALESYGPTCRCVEPYTGPHCEGCALPSLTFDAGGMFTCGIIQPLRPLQLEEMKDRHDAEDVGEEDVNSTWEAELAFIDLNSDYVLDGAEIETLLQEEGFPFEWWKRGAVEERIDAAEAKAARRIGEEYINKVIDLRDQDGDDLEAEAKALIGGLCSEFDVIEEDGFLSLDEVHQKLTEMGVQYESDFLDEEFEFATIADEFVDVNTECPLFWASLRFVLKRSRLFNTVSYSHCFGWDSAAEEALQPPTEIEFYEITAGVGHACGLTVSLPRQAVCWGDNNFGQAHPTPIESMINLSAGSRHTCAVPFEGEGVKCWGAQAPRTATFDEDMYGDESIVEGEGVDGAPKTGRYQSVGAGLGFSCALSSTGQVHCWGNNYYHQRNVPAAVMVYLAVGTYHACAIQKWNHAVVCWGRDDYGQVSGAPQQESHLQFRSVSVGEFHTCGLTMDSEAVCWGNDWDGQASAPPGIFESVSCGLQHTCGIRPDATVRCWGFHEAVQDLPLSRYRFQLCSLDTEDQAV